MPIYEVKVEARVYRTVTVEADSMDEAIIKANGEVISQIGAYRAETVSIKKEEDTSW